MLRAENAEVLADIARYRRKEGELSEYTQKLTDKNVNLQSEFQGCTKTATAPPTVGVSSNVLKCRDQSSYS